MGQEDARRQRLDRRAQGLRRCGARAIGRESPLDEFHRLILDEFTRLPSEAIEAAGTTFRTATITNDGVDLDSAGQHRSTSTWTYMVHDNLFSSGGAKMLQGILGVFR